MQSGVKRSVPSPHPHTRSRTHARTHTRAGASHWLLFHCAPQLCHDRPAREARTLRYRHYGSAATLSSRNTHALHTRTHTHSPSDSTLISSERASNRRDAKKWRALERLTRAQNQNQIAGKHGQLNKKRSRGFFCFFLLLRGNLHSVAEFSGSIVQTSLQRGHSEERGRTQKGKGKD